jgi:hypothetical protein
LDLQLKKYQAPQMVKEKCCEQLNHK